MDFVDSKVFVVDGCALGLLGLGYHPIVLSVYPNTLEFRDAHIGDGLCHIDGLGTRDIDQSSMWRLIQDASSLGFRHGPKSAVIDAAMQIWRVCKKEVDFVAKHVLKVEVMARNVKGVAMACPASNGAQRA